MKILTKLTSVFGIASVIAITTARGQVVVDEFGNGTYNGDSVDSGLMPDPYNGNAPGLAYSLAIPWNHVGPQVADIQLLDPGTGAVSDLLRFERNENLGDYYHTTLLFFYSQASGPSDPANLADVLTMPNPVNLILSVNETGLFGFPYMTAPGPSGWANGYVYTAPWNTPGNDGTIAGTEYTFISDVPEPGSAFLVSGGLGLLGGYRLLRRKTVA